MLAILLFIDFSNGNTILGSVPESLALLLFGVGLIASTLIMRRALRRHDRRAEITEAPAEDNQSF
jgi:hypothetical protein